MLIMMLPFILVHDHSHTIHLLCIFELVLVIQSLTYCKYGLPFYLSYLAHWPEYFQVAESANGTIMGYSK